MLCLQNGVVQQELTNGTPKFLPTELTSPPVMVQTPAERNSAPVLSASGSFPQGSKAWTRDLRSKQRWVPQLCIIT